MSRIRAVREDDGLYWLRAAATITHEGQPTAACEQSFSSFEALP